MSQWSYSSKFRGGQSRFQKHCLIDWAVLILYLLNPGLHCSATSWRTDKWKKPGYQKWTWKLAAGNSYQVKTTKCFSTSRTDWCLASLLLTIPTLIHRICDFENTTENTFYLSFYNITIWMGQSQHLVVTLDVSFKQYILNHWDFFLYQNLPSYYCIEYLIGNTRGANKMAPRDK